MILSAVAIVLAASFMGLVVRAAVTNVQVPIPNPTNITIKVSVTSSRYGGGDSLILDLSLAVTSTYPAGSTSVISGKVAVYNDTNVATATRYASVGFHHVIINGGETITVVKTVRVHHASMAAQDHTAFFLATALNKLSDGTVTTAQDTAVVDVASFIAQL